MGRLLAIAIVVGSWLGCAPGGTSDDPSMPGGDGNDGSDDPGEDDPIDPAELTLDDWRDRLFRANPALGEGGDVCARWTSLDPSRRAVYLTLTDRMFLSTTTDGLSLLAHTVSMDLILGGGDDGRACGDDENNRLFLTVDDDGYARVVETWGGMLSIDDGGGDKWARSGDATGAHEPFDASLETETGLRCLGLVELPGSYPPTGQIHFFLPGAAQPVERGDISLPLNPNLIEIDHDFDCLHRSNPLCPGESFDQEYVATYGDFDCMWIPRGCTAVGTACYPAAE